MNLLLIAIFAAVGIVSFKGFNDPAFFDKYKFNIARIQNGEKYRLLTSGFLHADIAHLFFNLLTLYFFAPVVINYFGDGIFILIYMMSLLAGNLFTLKIHESQPYYSAIGASGAIMGVLYAAILINPTMSLYLFFIPIPIPAYIVGVGYLLYSIYGMKKQNDLIGHTAHLGGALAGLFVTTLFDYQLIMENVMITLLLLIPVILLIVMLKKQ